MHLSTEQHGAYLLLLFHLWRRGILHDDDVVLAQITGLSRKCLEPGPAGAGGVLPDPRWTLAPWTRGAGKNPRSRPSNNPIPNKAKLAAAQQMEQASCCCPE